jgi:hypothetical protein
MAHRVGASLRITGDNFKHEDLTIMFELEPTYAWNIHDKKETGFVYTFSSWSYRSSLPEYMELDHHILWLMARFKGKEELFDTLPPETYVSLLCAVYIDVQDQSLGSTPPMGLEREAIRWLSRINANFDVDSYLCNILSK